MNRELVPTVTVPREELISMWRRYGNSDEHTIATFEQFARVCDHHMMWPRLPVEEAKKYFVWGTGARQHVCVMGTFNKLVDCYEFLAPIVGRTPKEVRAAMVWSDWSWGAFFSVQCPPGLAPILRDEDEPYTELFLIARSENLASLYEMNDRFIENEKLEDQERLYDHLQ